MPELPDVAVYVERLDALTRGETLHKVRLASPFLLRSVDPRLSAVHGKQVVGTRRLGKRIILALEDELFLVIHLMIAGRLRWKKPGTKPPGRGGLAAFDFDSGTLIFTEVSKKKRASLHVVRGEESLAEFDRGGLDTLAATTEQFAETLRSKSHTLKRALTDPRLFDGIGNAYSDEILWTAKLSPVQRTGNLTDEEVARLHAAVVDTLTTWTDRHRQAVGDGFPDKVTAFHAEMAVHGRYKEPCPECGHAVQRILYADRETNYCAACQTDGKVLRDRVLSQLLKKDWPARIEDLEGL